MTAPARPRLALLHGVLCHAAFAAAVAWMIVAMGTGMQAARGRLPPQLAWPANVLLLLLFAFGHSLLLTRRGRRLLARLVPGTAGEVLAPTLYVLVVSLQTLALFLLWTPSGVVWWTATGAARAALLALYALAWLLLGRAILDAGASVQTGWIGWRALARGRPPAWPPLPERGLFRLCRQPIYVAFALTTWTVPVWTPDQLLVATTLTLYCVLGPRAKEARFDRRFGARWRVYRHRVPYWLPWPRPRGGSRA